MAVWGIASVVISVVGAGISYYGQQQRAKAAERAARWNYTSARYEALRAQQNARLQAKQMENEAALMENQAAWLRYNQALGFANAKAQQKTAENIWLAGRENVRRERQEARRAMAVNEAKFAKSGVTMEGTPLSVQANNAKSFELDILEVSQQAEYEWRDMHREAWNTQAQARALDSDIGMTLSNAAATRINARNLRRYNVAPALNAAAWARSNGKQEAAGYRLASYQSLVEGANSASSTAYKKQQGAY